MTPLITCVAPNQNNISKEESCASPASYIKATSFDNQLEQDFLLQKQHDGKILIYKI